MKKSNTAVEAAFPLTLVHIKQDLAEAREKHIKVDGYVNFDNWGSGSAFDYYIEHYDDEDLLTINYGEKRQTVKIVQICLHFGFRTLYVCECSRRCAKLYLPLGGHEFKCRYCHGLYYESTRKSSTYKKGGKFYLAHKMLKTRKVLEGLNKMTYKGKFTKGYERWIKLSKELNVMTDIMRSKDPAVGVS